MFEKSVGETDGGIWCAHGPCLTHICPNAEHTAWYACRGAVKAAGLAPITTDEVPAEHCSLSPAAAAEFMVRVARCVGALMLLCCC
jgi:hypothetical protein